MSGEQKRPGAIFQASTPQVSIQWLFNRFQRSLDTRQCQCIFGGREKSSDCYIFPVDNHASFNEASQKSEFWGTYTWAQPTTQTIGVCTVQLTQHSARRVNVWTLLSSITDYSGMDYVLRNSKQYQMSWTWADKWGKSERAEDWEWNNQALTLLEPQLFESIYWFG